MSLVSGEMVRLVLPRRVIALRSGRWWSQAELARRSGVAASTLNEIEGGLGTGFRLETILKLCSALEVSPDYLLGFDRDERFALGAGHGDPPPGITPKCAFCDSLLAGPHSAEVCMQMMFGRGRSLAWIAHVWDVTISLAAEVVSGTHREFRASPRARRMASRR